MKLFVNTIVTYIKNDIEKELNKEGIWRYILPSYPADVLLELGEKVTEFLWSKYGAAAKLEYGIAFGLAKKWEKDLQNIEALKDIKAKGWLNQGNNLTELRNKTRPQGLKKFVIILAGYEEIEDRDSLKDFVHLDNENIWKLVMKKSFEPWLRRVISPENCVETVNDVFTWIYENYHSDLYDISSLIEECQFDKCVTADSIFEVLVNVISSKWNMPRLGGALKRGKNTKKTFGYYAREGMRFFRYETYKRATERNKILTKIERIRSEPWLLEEPKKWEKGGYYDLAELLDDLKSYIENNDQDAAKKLRTVDFPYLHDKILQKRIKSEPKEKKTEKKLRGLPPEIFWRAILITISEFMSRYYPKVEGFPDGIKITIASKRFNYNSYGSVDDETDETGAVRFLTRILGGIDSYLEEQLQDTFQNGSVVARLEYKSMENRLVLDSKKKTKNPYLEFIVKVELSDKYVEQKFGWEVPEYHLSSLFNNLIECLTREYKTKNELMLPLIGITYVKELFMAKGEETVVRIFLQGLNKSPIIRNLIENTKAASLFEGLMQQYYDFWKTVDCEGIFTALNTKFDTLRKEYEDTVKRCLEKRREGNEAYLILFKAFLITDIDTVNSDIEWEKRLPTSVVTPLHPALLELLHNQYTYLARSLSYILKNRKEPKTWLKEWNRIADLAGIKRPLFGMIGEENKLITNIESYEYIHLLGSVKEQPDFIDAKLLLEIDDEDNEDITEAEIFYQTQTSLLIEDLLRKYLKHHPYARDGMTITIYCGSRIQSIVAAIDHFLKELLNEGADVEPFSLQLTLISDAESDNEIINWINAWKDIWYQDEIGSSRAYYASCNINLRFRVVSRENTAEELKDLLKDNPSDIVILCDVIDDDNSEIKLTELTDFEDYIRFPILEKIACSREQNPKSVRHRIVSNQRFSLPLRHAEMLWIALTGQDALPKGKTSIVLASSSIRRLSSVITAAHDAGNWVICLDESIDKNLLLNLDNLGNSNSTLENKIEIVGFGTGVGSHGELNYTVSTTRYKMSTICKKLASEIEKVMGPLDISEEQKCNLTDVLIKAADDITGISLIGITGVERFVREFIGNAMVRNMLQKDEHAFCDEIVCLDDFPHWFNFDTNDHRRPDLLRLKVYLTDDCVSIDAQVIECKVGQEDKERIEQARQQLNGGVQHLISLFMPRTSKKSGGIDPNIPPDRRYWWMQLHRVITSKSIVREGQNYEQVIDALEKLSEGYFNINWQAAAFVFMTDNDGNKLIIDDNDEDWNFRFNVPDDGERNLQTLIVKVPRGFIISRCLGAEVQDYEDPFRKAKCIEIRWAKNGGKVLDYSQIEKSQKSSGNEEERNRNNEQVTQHGRGEDKQPETRKNEREQKTIATTIQVGGYPQRVFLGINPNTNQKIYWEFGHKELANRHLLVFGASGQGKTYAIQAILWELAKCGQNSIIIDYTEGFTDKQLDKLITTNLKPKQHYVIKQPLPINIFRRQKRYIDGLNDEEFTDKPSDVAHRVSGVFSAVYYLGEQQKGVLYDAITRGVKDKGSMFTLDDLTRMLEDIAEKGGPKSIPALAIVNKIRPFVDTEPFGPEDPESWEKMYSDSNNRCHIIQLTGFDSKEITRLVAEFALLDFYRYYRVYGNMGKPRVMVLDEAQNLDHSIESPIGQMLTEGRKFGISLILATQTLSNLSKKDERDRLFQAKHKLFFRPADTELGTFAKIIADILDEDTETWKRNLAELKKGECYSIGPAVEESKGEFRENACIKIRITPLENRMV